jgi:alkylation response protein AidB-like acyl-CoA dehydrogenase
VAFRVAPGHEDATLAYLKDRKQFGKPIGANQVLQHRMVDMLLEIEQARSAVMLAANTLEGPRDLRELNISAAKNLVGRVGRLVAEEAIQMHGGVAMTWEWPLPHFAKRVVMIDHMFGDTDHHLERFRDLSRELSSA